VFDARLLRFNKSVGQTVPRTHGALRQRTPDLTPCARSVCHGPRLSWSYPKSLTNTICRLLHNEQEVRANAHETRESLQQFRFTL